MNKFLRFFITSTILSALVAVVMATVYANQADSSIRKHEVVENIASVLPSPPEPQLASIIPSLEPGAASQSTSSTLTEVQTTAKDWTFMAYMAADNELSQIGLDNLNQMEAAGSDDNVNVIALLDLQGNNNTTLYYVTKDSPGNSAIVSQPVKDSPFPPEIDTGDPANLTKFVNWTIKNYPAKHYALLLWGHGLGWKGYGYDYSSGSNSINLSKLESALKSVKDTNGLPLDIVAFDSCLMQMSETASAIEKSQAANILVGSEEGVPGPGWDYNHVLNELKNNPEQSPVSFAANIIAQYLRTYPKDKISLSALSLADLDNLTSKLNDLASALISSGEWKAISQARDKAEHFNDSSYIDILDFAAKVQTSVNSPGVSKTVGELIEALNKAVIVDGHNDTHPNIHGLSIYFPSDGNIDPNYLKLDFATSQWREFLVKYAENVKKAGTPASPAPN